VYFPGSSVDRKPLRRFPFFPATVESSTQLRRTIAVTLACLAVGRGGSDRERAPCVKEVVRRTVTGMNRESGKMRGISRTGMLLLTAMALAWPAHGQQHESSEAAGGPFTDHPVLNAPFSADAITTVRERLPGGGVREQTVTAHYSRDSQGRVRAELDTAWGPYVVLWFPRQAAGTPGWTHGDFFNLIRPSESTGGRGTRSRRWSSTRRGASRCLLQGGSSEGPRRLKARRRPNGSVP
jgi:hypothetical protein